MTKYSKNVVGRALLGFVFCIVVSTFLSAQESASFKLKRFTLTPVAGRMISASYVNTVTATVEGGSCGVCPSGPAVAAGYWSVLGARTVPVELTARRNGSEPIGVDLSWTGQAEEFKVYRSISPIGVVAPQNVLLATDSCAASDEGAATFNILFYRVTPAEQ